MRLTLSAEMLLLTLDPNTGSPMSGQQGEGAVTAAVLVELCLRGRTVLEADRVVVADARPTGKRLLDTPLAVVAGRRPRSLSRVLGDIRADAVDAARRELLTEGVMADRSHRALGLFRVRRWGEVDPTVRAALRARLDAVVLRDQVPDERTAALIALVHGAELHEDAFPYDLSFRERRALRRRIAYLAAGAWAVPVLRDTVRITDVVARAALSGAVEGFGGGDGGGDGGGGG